MPEIPQNIRRERLATSSGNVLLPEQRGQSLAGIGSVATDLGLAFLKQADKAEVADQVNTFQAASLTEVDAYMRTLGPNTDPDEFNKGLQELLQARKDSLGEMKNPRARDIANQWYIGQSIDWTDDAFWRGKKVGLQQAGARYDLQVLSAEKRAVTAVSEQDFQDALGELEQYHLSAGGVGVTNDGVPGIISEEQSRLNLEVSLQRVAKGREEFVTRTNQEAVRLAAKDFATLDQAIDFIEKQGHEVGLSNADITSLISRERADRARAEAEKVEIETKRVADADIDLSRRMYSAETPTTSEQVFDANLPQVLRDKRLSEIRQRDKDIISEKKIVTSAKTRADINTRIGFVVSGENTVQQAVDQFLRDVQQDVAVSERPGVIDAIFKAGEDHKDDTKRQNQTILGERERKLRDSIEADPSIFVRPEERDILRDLANDAANELNDRYRNREFKIAEIDNVVDELKRKYSLSRQALIRARLSNQLLKAKTFKEQVKATQELFARLRRRGATADLSAALDEAIRLGLATPDGKPSTSVDGDALPDVEVKSILDAIRENL